MTDLNTSESTEELVDHVLDSAVSDGAGDVYWIPGPNEICVRIRKDGVLEFQGELPLDYGQRCVARLKVLAGLLTYRTKVSQDGAIKRCINGSNCEMRVSVMPTNYGERLSVRILQYEKGPVFLENLGFPSSVTATARHMLDRPTGMIVLTGPTGSGKTTTIYALIRELLRRQQDPASIITIEDPIECMIEGISQTAVSSDLKWGYASALRAALRQDVKTIVVGEMRDREVVQVTLDAALTGHRVITTYHAGDIPSVYARMLHQGFEPFLIASAITGVVSQRLVTAKGSSGRIPVAAALDPGDSWRDFVAKGPGLVALRKRIASIPGASLEAAADALFAEDRISEDVRQTLSSANTE